jgi:hypothetical protein
MNRGGMFIVAACLGMLGLGCGGREVTDSTANGMVTVIGKLVAVKDDRPADGGVDLTVETGGGKREILRVGSAFIAGPREPVLALHRVVDAAKVGDRLKASGHRESSGALIVERLEILD